MTPSDVVPRYFEAMRGGIEAIETLLALFAEDAVYIEPFAGQMRTHEGIRAIERCLREGFVDAPPDMTLELGRVDVDGAVVRSEWTCVSPAFPHPMNGVDVCTVKDGRIQRLEVRFR